MTDKTRACRVCGCTDLDCSGCIERTGEPCRWVDDTLCSACAPYEVEVERGTGDGIVKTQRSLFRCSSCSTIFETRAEVDIPVSLYVSRMLAMRCPACGSKKLLMGQGRSIPEDRTFYRGATLAQRVEGWLVNGEVGSSSMSILHALSGRGSRETEAPHDVSDVRRCLLLLDRIPEWRPRIGEMACVSPAWKRFADGWNDMVTAIVQELGPDLVAGKAPRSAEIVDALRSAA